MRVGSTSFLIKDSGFYQTMITGAVGPNAIAAYEELRCRVWRSSHAGNPQIQKEFISGRLSTNVRQSSLCAALNLSKRQVQRVVNKLRRIGWVRTADGSGKGAALVYELGYMLPGGIEVFYADADCRDLYLHIEAYALLNYMKVPHVPASVRAQMAKDWIQIESRSVSRHGPITRDGVPYKTIKNPVPLEQRSPETRSEQAFNEKWGITSNPNKNAPVTAIFQPSPHIKRMEAALQLVAEKRKLLEEQRILGRQLYCPSIPTSDPTSSHSSVQNQTSAHDTAQAVSTTPKTTTYAHISAQNNTPSKPPQNEPQTVKIFKVDSIYKDAVMSIVNGYKNQALSVCPVVSKWHHSGSLNVTTLGAYVSPPLRYNRKDLKDKSKKEEKVSTGATLGASNLSTQESLNLARGSSSEEEKTENSENMKTLENEKFRDEGNTSPEEDLTLPRKKQFEQLVQATKDQSNQVRLIKEQRQKLKAERTKALSNEDASRTKPSKSNNKKSYNSKTFIVGARVWAIYAQLVQQINPAYPVIPWDAKGNAKARGQVAQLLDMYGEEAVCNTFEYVFSNWDALMKRFFPKRAGVGAPNVGFVLAMHETLFREAVIYAPYAATLREWADFFKANKGAPSADLMKRHKKASEAMKALGLK